MTHPGHTTQTSAAVRSAFYMFLRTQLPTLQLSTYMNPWVLYSVFVIDRKSLWCHLSNISIGHEQHDTASGDPSAEGFDFHYCPFFGARHLSPSPEWNRGSSFRRHPTELGCSASTVNIMGDTIASIRAIRCIGHNVRAWSGLRDAFGMTERQW